MSRDLRFRRLRLRNWKNFLQVDVSRSRIAFFSWERTPRGSRTSWMPFASSAIIALSGSSFREAVVHPRRGGVSGIRCLAAREYPDVEIAVQLEEEGDGAACEYKTYSSDLLRDEGIGLDETIPLVPGAEGTEVVPAGSNQEMRKLLEGGLSLAEIAMPKTRPENAAQLALFGDA